MELFILKENLKKGINLTERICPKSSLTALPILKNILLVAKNNFINLSSTDLEIAVTWQGLAKIKKEGEVVAPLNLISSLISFLPEEQIRMIKEKNNDIVIECGSFKNKIKGFSAEDFPIIPKIKKEDNFIEISSGILCESIKQLIEIPALSQNKPEISGVYFSFQKNTIKIAATDSFRLAEKTIILENKENDFLQKNKEISFILPQKTCKEIINIFNEKEEKIKIFFSENQVFLEQNLSLTTNEKVQLMSKLVEGEYPNYQEIIPKKFNTQIVLPKNIFLNHIKAASVFSGKINEIKIRVVPKEKRIEVFSQNPESGEHSSFLIGETKGDPCEISFNHRFLLTGLQNIKSDKVFFGLNSEDEPACLKPTNDDDYLYIVMPIKAG